MSEQKRDADKKKSAAPEETALNFDHPNYPLEKAPWAFVIEVELLQKNLVDGY